MSNQKGKKNSDILCEPLNIPFLYYVEEKTIELKKKKLFRNSMELLGILAKDWDNLPASERQKYVKLNEQSIKAHKEYLEDQIEEYRRNAILRAKQKQDSLQKKEETIDNQQITINESKQKNQSKKQKSYKKQSLTHPENEIQQFKQNAQEIKKQAQKKKTAGGNDSDLDQDDNDTILVVDPKENYKAILSYFNGLVEKKKTRKK